jgi:hypothetical protein
MCNKEKLTLEFVPLVVDIPQLYIICDQDDDDDSNDGDEFVVVESLRRYPHCRTNSEQIVLKSTCTTDYSIKSCTSSVTPSCNSEKRREIVHSIEKFTECQFETIGRETRLGSIKYDSNWGMTMATLVD